MQKSKDMFSSKKASDIEKLAYAAAFEKEAFMGALVGAPIGAVVGGLKADPGTKFDGIGHGTFRGAGAGAGASIGGLGGLMLSAALSKNDASTARKILQTIIPFAGAGIGGGLGYATSKAIGGESITEKKRRNEEAMRKILGEKDEEKEASEKEASLAVRLL